MTSIRSRRRSVYFLLLAIASAPLTLVRADVRLPAIFSDHMVLQRDGSAPIWGWADPGEKITVTAGSAKATATAADDGQWTAKLENLPVSGEPMEITVAGKNTITIHDVLVGDVWVCSGQSNMEFGIKAFMPAEELKDQNNPQIRIFSVPKWVAPSPQKDIAPAPENCPGLGKWWVCTPEALTKSGEWSGFPATGYYFGRNIQEYTHQPVGLIGSCWGGTRINSWTSLDTLESEKSMASLAKGAASFRDNYEEIKKKYETETLPEWNATLAKWKEDNKEALEAYDAAQKKWREEANAATAEKKPAPARPVAPKQPRPPRDPIHDNQTSAALYNGMIAPLIPYGIKGAIWYQGESNGDQPVFYRVALPALIKDWRSHWGQGDFPFIVVQLPNFKPVRPEPADSPWAGVREAQAKTALEVPNTGLATTIDIGEAGNIHPADKFDVGYRLALAAEHVAYGDANVVYSGPVYKSSEVEGKTIRIKFDNIGGGLVTGLPPEHFYVSEKKTRPEAPDETLKGFAIAGADHKYVWAKATIDGDSVVVSSDAVAEPVSVRYAWADNPECNLYNKEGLPAVPFRTDDLPLQK